MKGSHGRPTDVESTQMDAARPEGLDAHSSRADGQSQSASSENRLESQSDMSLPGIPPNVDGIRPNALRSGQLFSRLRWHSYQAAVLNDDCDDYYQAAICNPAAHLRTAVEILGGLAQAAVTRSSDSLPILCPHIFDQIDQASRRLLELRSDRANVMREDVRLKLMEETPPSETYQPQATLWRQEKLGENICRTLVDEPILNPLRLHLLDVYRAQRNAIPSAGQDVSAWFELGDVLDQMICRADVFAWLVDDDSCTVLLESRWTRFYAARVRELGRGGAFREFDHGSLMPWNLCSRQSADLRPAASWPSLFAQAARTAGLDEVRVKPPGIEAMSDAEHLLRCFMELSRLVYAEAARADAGDWKRRLKVTIDPPMVELDGFQYDTRHKINKRIAIVFRELLDAPGHATSLEEIKKKHPGSFSADGRFNRLQKRMPASLAAIVESTSGLGLRLVHPSV